MFSFLPILAYLQNPCSDFLRYSKAHVCCMSHFLFYFGVFKLTLATATNRKLVGQQLIFVTVSKKYMIFLV